MDPITFGIIGTMIFGWEARVLFQSIPLEEKLSQAEKDLRDAEFMANYLTKLSNGTSTFVPEYRIKAEKLKSEIQSLNKEIALRDA